VDVTYFLPMQDWYLLCHPIDRPSKTEARYTVPELHSIVQQMHQILPRVALFAVSNSLTADNYSRLQWAFDR